MNPSTLIFLGLAVVWVIVLLPEAIRKLSATRSSDSIRAFNHQLSALRRQGDHGPVGSSMGSNVINMRGGLDNHSARSPQNAPAQVPAAVRKRRQEVITALASAAVLTLLCAIAFGPAFLVLHIVADVLLVTYLALVAQANKAPAPAARQSLSGGYSPMPEHGLRTATVSRVTPTGRRVAN